MSDTRKTLDDFARYAELIRGMLDAAAPESFDREDASSIQVERGVIFAQSLLSGYSAEMLGNVEPLLVATLSGAPDERSIVDAAGHRRPAYRALLIYAWLQSYRAMYETLPAAEFARWEEPLRAWCDLLESDLGGAALADDGINANKGGVAARAAWSALALHVAGKLFIRDAWTDLAADTFGRLTRPQQPEGALLIADVSDNPEARWFDELVILHAMASYAVQAEDRTVAGAVRRATEYHLAETQADHATAEPWALFAFIWNPRTHSVADQMLHAASAQRSGTSAGVTLMLLADALYCLKLFLGP